MNKSAWSKAKSNSGAPLMGAPTQRKAKKAFTGWAGGTPKKKGK